VPAPSDRDCSDAFDWNLLITSPLNAILCGNRAILDETLSSLRAHLAVPLYEWSCNDGSRLPSISTGTLIVSGLDHATVAHQRAFLEWLDTHDRVRVITLSERPLFHRVKRGALIEELYYRLNLIYCEASQLRRPGNPRRSGT
jgi:hypothetical protein